MNEHETRSTPETDALISRMSDEGLDLYDREDELKEHAFKLERERDEAREANAVIQAREAELVLSKDRMQTMAASVADVIAKRDAMLGAIVEASALIADCSGRASDATLQMHANNDAKGVVDDVWLWSEEALAKLKPFLL